MINSLSFKFGSSANKTNLIITLSPVTVFVGPNNSGKSKVLKEIESACIEGKMGANDVILQTLSFNKLGNPNEEFENLLKTSSKTNEGAVIVGKTGRNTYHILPDQLKNIIQNQNSNLTNFCLFYLGAKTIRIDGGTRIQLINDQAAGDLQKPALSSFNILFRDIEKRKEVRRILFDAFKKYFVIDPTSLSSLRLRLSDRAPADEIEECGIHTGAVEFHSKANLISDSSDGVKAFTGIVTSLIAGEPKIALIDEPEAFLHPPLALNLGKEISKIANGSEKSLVISTHSSNFLMGCISSGVSINIVRLTYLNKVPTVRLLPSEKLLRLMRHPLLRSTGLLNGLFYDYVIVTEADADRAFYQEVNERLLTYTDQGISNCLFINAQNKHTLHELIKPLRELGIPCAAIVDVDVIKEGGTSWTNLLKSGFIPEVTIQSLAASRGFIKSKFDETKKDFKKQGGVNVLKTEDRESCNNLFDQLDSYGIFVVRNGELESWLKPLNIKASHSPDWLIEAFDKLGDDPNSDTYIKPNTGDVWDFIGNLKTWFENPSRKGIPD